MKRPQTSILSSAALMAVAAFGFVFSSPAVRAENPKVVIQTTEGDIYVELFEEEAPVTVANFLMYVDKNHYNGTIFHRVIKDFMIQGGGLDPTMKERKTEDPIINESKNGLKNEKYTLAMARKTNPSSATSQFFINTVYNDFLDRAKAQDRVGYCVFGKVYKGQEVVDKIAKVKTISKGSHTNVPVDAIIINRVKVLKGDEDEKTDEAVKAAEPKKEEAADAPKP